MIAAAAVNRPRRSFAEILDKQDDDFFNVTVEKVIEQRAGDSKNECTAC